LASVVLAEGRGRREKGKGRKRRLYASTASINLQEKERIYSL